MLRKNLFTSLLALISKSWVESREYIEWDIVIDHESNHNLYLFESGWYTVWAVSPFGGLHEIGEIDAPSILGEGVFFGSFKKPVKVVTKSWGKVYILTEKDIARLGRENIGFHETLMRACLAVTNERIREANMERTIGYALVDGLETGHFRTIPTLLSTLKNTFSLTDVIWIERHEVLQDIFSIRFRETSGTFMINERLRHPLEVTGYAVEKWLFWTGYAHIFALESRGECYGYLIYTTEEERISGYIRRITVDMIPNCIRLIEAGWKK